MSWHSYNHGESPLHSVSSSEVGNIPKGGILSPDLEYPPCPNCDDNEGVFTTICQNKSRFRCNKCKCEYGNVDSFTTIRDLESPLIEDYIACIINNQNIEDLALDTDRDKCDIKSNLRAADEQLSKTWLDQMQIEGLD